MRKVSSAVIDLPLTIFFTLVGPGNIGNDGVGLKGGVGNVHLDPSRFGAGFEGREELLEVGDGRIFPCGDLGDERVEIDSLEGFRPGSLKGRCKVIQSGAQELILKRSLQVFLVSFEVTGGRDHGSSPEVTGRAFRFESSQEAP